MVPGVAVITAAHTGSADAGVIESNAETGILGKQVIPVPVVVTDSIKRGSTGRQVTPALKLQSRFMIKPLKSAIGGIEVKLLWPQNKLAKPARDDGRVVSLLDVQSTVRRSEGSDGRLVNWFWLQFTAFRLGVNAGSDVN